MGFHRALADHSLQAFIVLWLLAQAAHVGWEGDRIKEGRQKAPIGAFLGATGGRWGILGLEGPPLEGARIKPMDQSSSRPGSGGRLFMAPIQVPILQQIRLKPSRGPHQRPIRLTPS